MGHMHVMKTRDRNRHVVAALLKGGRVSSSTPTTQHTTAAVVSVVKAPTKGPSPSDSVRKGSKASDTIFGPEVVGRKVAVYRSKKGGEWLTGRIQSYASGKKTHVVRYDGSGDQAEINLSRERFQFTTKPKPGAKPNPSYEHAPKGKEAVGHRVKVYWPAMGKWYVGRIKDYDRGTGKHLVAYQDGEQHSVLLRNEAVKYPSHTSPQAAKAKAAAAQAEAAAAGAGASAKEGDQPSPNRRSARREAKHGVKRGASDTQHSNESEQVACVGLHDEANSGEDKHAKRVKYAPSTRPAMPPHAEEAGTTLPPSPRVMMAVDSFTEMSDGCPAMRCEVQSPKTPENEIFSSGVPVQELKEAPVDEEDDAAHTHEHTKTLAGGGGMSVAKVEAKQGLLAKAQEAKQKAMEAEEVAAKKAEEAAKAIASVFVKADPAASEERKGEDAVGWRVKLWDAGMHRFTACKIVAFCTKSNQHAVELPDGHRRDVCLSDQRVKWVSKEEPAWMPAEDGRGAGGDPFVGAKKGGKNKKAARLDCPPTTHRPSQAAAGACHGADLDPINNLHIALGLWPPLESKSKLASPPPSLEDAWGFCMAEPAAVREELDEEQCLLSRIDLMRSLSQFESLSTLESLDF